MVTLSASRIIRRTSFSGGAGIVCALEALTQRLEWRDTAFFDTRFARHRIPPSGLAALVFRPGRFIKNRRDKGLVTWTIVRRHRQLCVREDFARQRFRLAATCQHIQLVDRLGDRVVTMGQPSQESHVGFVGLVDVLDLDQRQLGATRGENPCLEVN